MKRLCHADFGLLDFRLAPHNSERGARGFNLTSSYFSDLLLHLLPKVGKSSSPFMCLLMLPGVSMDDDILGSSDGMIAQTVY